MKASESYWNKKRCIILGDDESSRALEEPYKEVYDQLVTLEAKIEYIADSIRFGFGSQSDEDMVKIDLVNFTQDYNQLIKTHQLDQ